MSDASARTVGYMMSQAGFLTERREQLMPFLIDLAEALDERQLIDTPDGVEVPWASGNTKPVMFLDPVTAAVGVCLVVGNRLMEATVDVSLEALLTGVVWPKVRHLAAKRRGSSWSDRPVRVHLGLWHQADNVYIGVVSLLGTDEADDEQAVLLMDEALKRGREWVRKHGVSKPVLLYRVENGELSPQPILRDTVPNATTLDAAL